MGKEADGRFFIQKGVGDFLVFALLPVGEDCFPRVRFEKNGTVFFGLEIVGSDLLAVDEGEGGTVGEGRAEFFHEVKGK